MYDYFNPNSSFNEMFRSTAPWDHTQSFVYNSITWQLGGHLRAADREPAAGAGAGAGAGNHRDRYGGSYHATLRALERAKQNLMKMGFVGFFENLHVDYWRLRTKIY